MLGSWLSRFSPFFLSIRLCDDGETAFDGRSSTRYGQVTCSCLSGLMNAFLCFRRGAFSTLLETGRRLLALDDHEMHALRIASQCALLRPHAFLCPANTVCITQGPLQGLKGYMEKHGCDLMFVVNIHLIQKSFAIRVHATDLELAG